VVFDEGAKWPTASALKELAADVKAKIGALVKKTVSCGLTTGVRTPDDNIIGLIR